MREQNAWCWRISPSSGEVLAAHQLSCLPILLETPRKCIGEAMTLPVRFVENDDLVAAWRQCHLFLSKRLDLVPYDVDASVTRLCDALKQWTGCHPTVHLKHSAPVHPPCTRPPASDALNNGYWLFSQSLAFPLTVIRVLSIAERIAQTVMMIWGQLPSLAITFSRSIVSAFPTMSSSTSGRYFSTLKERELRVMQNTSRC